MELCSGLREEGYLRDLRGVCGGGLPEAVVRNLGRRSVADAHREAAHRAGLDDWAALYTDEGAASPLHVVSEQLMDYDELWLRWRTEHVALVRRMVGGSTRGTGGTEIGYLERTLRHRFFPYLWESRDTLAVGPAGEDHRCGGDAG